MKKIILLLFVSAGVSFAHAQKIQQKDVPATVEKALHTQFPDAKNIKWEKEKADYEAGFKLNGIEYSVVINNSGSILETEVSINSNTLLAPISKYIAQNYPNKKIKEATKITDAKGVITYEVEINETDVIFDRTGNFLKEIKEKD
ncbi:MAG: hypothetical protein QM737_13635 [Ferruginibacter sp.]